MAKRKPVLDETMARAIARSFRVGPNVGSKHGLSSPSIESAGIDLSALPTSTTVIGVATRGHMNDAAVKIIRDPDSPYEALIVLADDKVTDKAYLVADHVLMKDKRAVPAPPSRRVISILPDQTLRLETEGRTRWARSRIRVENVTGTVSKNVLRRLKNSKTIHVDGIGPVKIVIDPTNSSNSVSAR